MTEHGLPRAAGSPPRVPPEAPTRGAPRSGCPCSSRAGHGAPGGPCRLQPLVACDTGPTPALARQSRVPEGRCPARSPAAAAGPREEDAVSSQVLPSVSERPLRAPPASFSPHGRRVRLQAPRATCARPRPHLSAGRPRRGRPIPAPPRSRSAPHQRRPSGLHLPPPAPRAGPRPPSAEPLGPAHPAARGGDWASSPVTPRLPRAPIGRRRRQSAAGPRRPLVVTAPCGAGALRAAVVAAVAAAAAASGARQGAVLSASPPPLPVRARRHGHQHYGLHAAAAPQQRRAPARRPGEAAAAPPAPQRAGPPRLPGGAGPPASR